MCSCCLLQNGSSRLHSFSKHNAQYAHMILDEVLDRSPKVSWDEIAGLDVAKQILQVCSWICTAK